MSLEMRAKESFTDHGSLGISRCVSLGVIDRDEIKFDFALGIDALNTGPSTNRVIRYMGTPGDVRSTILVNDHVLKALTRIAPGNDVGLGRKAHGHTL